MIAFFEPISAMYNLGNSQPKLLSFVLAYCQEVEKEYSLIDDGRKEILEEFAHSLKKEVAVAAHQEVGLTFICTHNSRRSHLAQVWAATALAYYGVQYNIATYSGGTEVTACNTRTIAALQRAGFDIANGATGSITNPHYIISFADDRQPITAFSKKYTDSPNPSSNFFAVMTCTDADEKCPIVFGALGRIALPYIDPKISDDTPDEAVTYDERCRQIAREMMYFVSKLQ